jgi:hypothetical protein
MTIGLRWCPRRPCCDELLDYRCWIRPHGIAEGKQFDDVKTSFAFPNFDHVILRLSQPITDLLLSKARCKPRLTKKIR